MLIELGCTCEFIEMTMYIFERLYLYNVLKKISLDRDGVRFKFVFHENLHRASLM